MAEGILALTRSIGPPVRLADSPSSALTSRLESLRTGFVVFRIVLAGAGIVGIAVLALYPHTASFTVDAHTEILSVKIRKDDAAPSLGLPSTIIENGELTTLDCSGLNFNFLPKRSEDFDARINLTPRSTPTNGVPSDAASITMVIADARAPFAELDCPDGRSQLLRSPLTLVFRNQEPRDGLTLHLRGVLTLGGSLHDVSAAKPSGRQLTLLDGVLSSEASSWPVPSSRSVVETPLHLGDMVSFGSTNPGSGQTAEILVRTLDGPTTGPQLHVVAHAEAAQALVSISGVRATDTVLAFAPNLWARVQAMDVWAALALIATLFIGQIERLFEHMDRVGAQKTKQTREHPKKNV
jgi:hypothetical protein